MDRTIFAWLKYVQAYNTQAGESNKVHEHEHMGKQISQQTLNSMFYIVEYRISKLHYIHDEYRCTFVNFVKTNSTFSERVYQCA